MKNLLTLLALFCATMMFSQNFHWYVYDFEVRPDDETQVVNAFNEFFQSDMGKTMPFASLNISMFSNSKTKFTHRVIFWSENAADLAKIYTPQMQASKDTRLLFSTLNRSIKPSSAKMGKALIFGQNENRYSTVYEMGVKDPVAYAAAFTELRNAMTKASGGKLGLDLHQIISGNEPGTTHAVVASAPSMAELMELSDMVFASSAFKTFSAKVKDIREVKNIYSLLQAARYNMTP